MLVFLIICYFDNHLVVGIINNGIFLCSSSDAINIISSTYEGKSSKYDFSDEKYKNSIMNIKMKYLNNLKVATGIKKHWH